MTEHKLSDLRPCNECGQMCGWCESCLDWRHRNPKWVCWLIRTTHIVEVNSDLLQERG